MGKCQDRFAWIVPFNDPSLVSWVRSFIGLYVRFEGKNLIHEGEFVVNIGACTGEYTIYAAKNVGQTGKVLASSRTQITMLLWLQIRIILALIMYSASMRALQMPARPCSCIELKNLWRVALSMINTKPTIRSAQPPPWRYLVIA